MQLAIHHPTPLEYFTTLVADDSSFPLLEAAASIAQDEYPELDVQEVLSQVDQLIERLRRRIPRDAAVLQVLRSLQQYFYQELKFSGNANDYYASDNSYLNAVLRTRQGIPISLAVLWLEMAQALGLKAYGISFPGHFMIKVALPHGQAVFDPLSGRSLSKEDLGERLEPYQRANGWDDELDIPLGLYLQPATPREIITRMLRNLKETHKAHADWPRFIAVQNRLIALLPQAWPEYRDRGLALVEMDEKLAGRSAALHDLEIYLSHAGNAQDASAIAELIAGLRA